MTVIDPNVRDRQGAKSTTGRLRDKVLIPCGQEQQRKDQDYASGSLFFEVRLV